MAKPLKVWSGAEWVNVSSFASGTGGSASGTPFNIFNTLVSRSASGSFQIGAVDFDTSASFIALPGRLYWNNEEGTLDLGMNNDVIQSMGMEFYLPPTKNDSGELIPPGAFVMATGAQGDRITIAKAITDGSVDPMFMVGVAAHSIVDGSEDGLITTNGLVKDINTASFTIGTVLYPDPNLAGGWTDTKPSAPAIRTPVAIVVRQHENTGRIYVRMSNGSVLGGTDTNVQFTTLSDNDILTYSQSSSYWTNQNLASAIQEVDGTGSGIDADLLDGQHGSYYAPIDSPTFTGSADFTSAVVYGVFPDQSGNSGKYLYTDGTDVSWQGLSTPFTAFEYIATASQTSFSGLDDNGITLSYDPGNLSVYLNGILLQNSDYIATSGSSVVLNEAADLNDSVAIVAFGIVAFADFYTQTEVNNNFLRQDTASATYATLSLLDNSEIMFIMGAL